MKTVKYKDDFGDGDYALYDVEYMEHGDEDYFDKQVINLKVKAADDDSWADSFRGSTVVEVNDDGSSVSFNMGDETIRLEYSECTELLLALHVWRKSSDQFEPVLKRVTEEKEDIVEE